MPRFKRAGTDLMRLPAGMLVGLLLLSACSASQTTAPTLAYSYDGLLPIDGTQMSRVWIREGFSLAGYEKVMLVGAGIQYRPAPPNQQPSADVAPQIRQLSAAQKQDLVELITEEFDRALDRLTLEEVDAPGPDVLLVRGTMLDVVARSAGDTSASAGYRLESVGQMTFMVELIDSESNAVLVRALDTRSARTPGQAADASEDPQAGLRDLMSRWAGMLVDALNDLTAVAELQGA